MSELNYKEFCELIGNIYDELPDEIKNNRFGIMCEEHPAPIFEDALKNGNVVFGYSSPYFGDSIMMCYWGFKAHGSFDRDHIARVLKHEFEHWLMGKTSKPLKHSEHHE